MQRLLITRRCKKGKRETVSCKIKYKQKMPLLKYAEDEAGPDQSKYFLGILVCIAGEIP